MSLNSKSGDIFGDKIIVITVIKILNPVENFILFHKQMYVSFLINMIKHIHGDVGKTVHLTFYIKDCIKIK